MPGRVERERRHASLGLRCRYAPTFCCSLAHAPGTHGPARAPAVCGAQRADSASDCMGSAAIDSSPGASYTAPGCRETSQAADIVLFAPDTMASKLREPVYTLSGGAMHVKQGALGIDDVIINGEVLLERRSRMQSAPLFLP